MHTYKKISLESLRFTLFVHFLYNFNDVFHHKTITVQFHNIRIEPHHVNR